MAAEWQHGPAGETWACGWKRPRGEPVPGHDASKVWRAFGRHGVSEGYVVRDLTGPSAYSWRRRLRAGAGGKSPKRMIRAYPRSVMEHIVPLRPEPILEALHICLICLGPRIAVG